jgi:hypothetical protein
MQNASGDGIKKLLAAEQEAQRIIAEARKGPPRRRPPGPRAHAERGAASHPPLSAAHPQAFARAQALLPARSPPPGA